MKILNLAYQEKSEIKYQKIKFPDGQQNIVLSEDPASYDVKIKSRLNNFIDLELISCAVASLRAAKVSEIRLYVPYVLGSRSDRKFELGGNNYLKDVISPIINRLNLESITTIDPHSDVLEACLNNFSKIDNAELVKTFLSNNYNGQQKDKYILISPDAGSTKKIFNIAKQIDYHGDIITCSKHRSADGKLNFISVPVPKYMPEPKDFIIIDDICDGGATFINIAKELKVLHPSSKIYLIITHGIFSKGFGELAQYFNGIYTTNSYQDLEGCEPFVKQLNIF